jgi:hypothetical protein
MVPAILPSSAPAADETIHLDMLQFHLKPYKQGM